MNERLEALARLVDGWFWETDQNHRFTYLSDSVESILGVPAAWHYGKSRRDIRVAEPDDETDWSRHFQTLDLRLEFKNFIYKISGPNGARCLSTSGEPFFDAQGEFLGYRGVARDVTSEIYITGKGDWIADVLDQINEGIAVWDQSDRLIIFNRAFRKSHPGMQAVLAPGLTYGDYVRGTVERGYIPAALADRETWVTNWLEQPRNIGVTLEIEQDNGRAFLVNEKQIENGVRITIVSNVTKLKTAQKNFALSKQRLEDFALSATDFFWETDANQKFSYIGDKVEQIIGVNPEDIIGLTRIEFFDADRNDSEAWRRHRDDLMAHRPFRDLRMPRTKHDGQKIWVSISGRPVFAADGAFLGYRGTTTDVTEAVEAEWRIEQAKNRADDASRAKSEFLSSVSHELRTPLNAILGFSQLLQLEDERSLSDDQRRAADQIQRSGKHLLTLINDVLDLTSIEAGQVSLSVEEVDVLDLLEECVSSLMPVARQENINLAAEFGDCGASVVSADRTRLRQIILNLVSNGIKYNQANGDCIVRVSSKAGTLRVSIEDNGIGIPIEKQRLLFQPFSRLGAETSEIQGTGIGLAISKKLAELMHCTIGFESAAGVGSTFWLDLPYTSTREKILNPTVERIGSAMSTWCKVKEKRQTPFTILYVEDNPANLLLMERIVSQLTDAKLLTATSAERGLAMAVEHQPDVVLMDINLPRMSGTEAMKRMKLNSVTREIPVIAVSADAMPQSVESGLEAGFQDYLAKPIKVPEIIEVLLGIRDAGSTKRAAAGAGSQS